MAARAALWDTKVPRTRSVEYKARKLRLIATAGNEGVSGNMDTEQDSLSGFNTRQVQTATDFELPDYWDEGEVLDGRQHWPVCITLNRVLEHSFLDATPQEEAAISLRLLLIFSFDPKHTANLHGMRMLGNSELTFDQLSSLIVVCVLTPQLFKNQLLKNIRMEKDMHERFTSL